MAKGQKGEAYAKLQRAASITGKIVESTIEVFFWLNREKNQCKENGMFAELYKGNNENNRAGMIFG